MKTSKSSLISENDRNIIFSDIETILTLNSTFLKQLQERMKGYNKKTLLSDVFLSFLPHFKMYTQYCSNYNTALELVNRLCNDNSRFRAFIKKTEAKTMKKFCDFLILPVQRVPRYVLLLDVLIKYTDQNHPDFENLKKAHDEAKIAASAINKKLEEAQNRAKVVSIRNRFDEIIDDCLSESLVQPHRVFFQEGVLEVKNAGSYLDDSEEDEQEPEEKGKYYCFLFNDLFLVGQAFGIGKEKRLVYDISFDLETTFIKKDVDELCFQLVNPRCTYVFKSSSIFEKELWINNIDKCIQSLLTINSNVSNIRKQVHLKLNEANNIWEAELRTITPKIDPEEYRENVLDYTQQILAEFLAENHQELMKKKVYSPNSLCKSKSVLKRVKETLTPIKKKNSSKCDQENQYNFNMAFNRASVNFSQELKLIHEDSDGASCLTRHLEFLQKQLNEMRDSKNKDSNSSSKRLLKSKKSEIMSPSKTIKSKRKNYRLSLDSNTFRKIRSNSVL